MKEVQNLYSEKLQKKKLKESNEDLNKYKDTPCSRTGIPLIWLYAPN